MMRLLIVTVTVQTPPPSSRRDAGIQGHEWQIRRGGLNGYSSLQSDRPVDRNLKDLDQWR